MPKSRALKEVMAMPTASMQRMKSNKSILKQVHKDAKESMGYAKESMVRAKVQMVGAKMMMKGM